MTGDLVDRLRSALDEAEQIQPLNKTGDERAHVLRTIQAHRKILDRHSPDSVSAGDPYCNWCSRYIPGDFPAPDWPCPDVRDLASIYFPEGTPE